MHSRLASAALSTRLLSWAALRGQDTYSRTFSAPFLLRVYSSRNITNSNLGTVTHAVYPAAPCQAVGALWRSSASRRSAYLHNATSDQREEEFSRRYWLFLLAALFSSYKRTAFVPCCVSR